MEEQKNNVTEIGKGERAGSGMATKMAREDNTAPGGGGMLEKAKETADTLLDRAKTGAGDAYDTVADKASSVIKDQKTELTAGLSGAADTVRRVSGAISDGDVKNGVTESAAQYAQTAARKLENAAQYFERTDLKGIARDAESYAKRNPAIFLGAAFALGVLAARFIKSSADPEPLSSAAGRHLPPAKTFDSQAVARSI